MLFTLTVHSELPAASGESGGVGGERGGALASSWWWLDGGALAGETSMAACDVAMAGVASGSGVASTREMLSAPTLSAASPCKCGK